jgi:hypothetical protein
LLIPYPKSLFKFNQLYNMVPYLRWTIQLPLALDFNHSKHEAICYKNSHHHTSKRSIHQDDLQIVFQRCLQWIPYNPYHYVNWSSWWRNHFMLLVLNSWSHEPTWPWHYGNMHMDPFQCYCSLWPNQLQWVATYKAYHGYYMHEYSQLQIC